MAPEIEFPHSKAFIEMSLTGMVVADTKLIVQRCNPAYAQILEYNSHEDVVGRRLDEGWSPETRRTLFSIHRHHKYPSGDSPILSLEFRTHRGNYRFLRVRGIVLRDSRDQILSVAGHVQDISEDKYRWLEADRARTRLIGQVRDLTAQLEVLKKTVQAEILESTKPLLQRMLTSTKDPLILADVQHLKDHLLNLLQGEEQPTVVLSPAETRVARLIRDGLTSKEAATALNIGIRTVETHRANIRKRLGITLSGQSMVPLLQELGL